jgi:hypothetical protein
VLVGAPVPVPVPVGIPVPVPVPIGSVVAVELVVVDVPGRELSPVSLSLLPQAVVARMPHAADMDTRLTNFSVLIIEADSLKLQALFADLVGTPGF